MSRDYNAIILGLGGMGSAALYHLARAGWKVLGLEQFGTGHDKGSSHGHSRIIREVYYNHPSYVPFVQRAMTLWQELQASSGLPLLHITGGLDISPAGGTFVQGALRACRAHGLDHEYLDAAAVNARFPAYNLPADYAAVYSPHAGILVPELCIQAHIKMAQADGADIAENTRVTAINSTDKGVTVTTAAGEQFHAQQLVITAGAWLGKILPVLDEYARPERQVVAWYEPADKAAFSQERFPIFILCTEDDSEEWYGFPSFGDDPPKFARFVKSGHAIDPDHLDRTCHPEDAALINELTQTYFAVPMDGPVRMNACMFTFTPDKHFILGRHPEDSNIYIAGGFSGHGYKFCSAVGEIIAQELAGEETGLDLSLHRLDRFGL